MDMYCIMDFFVQKSIGCLQIFCNIDEFLRMPWILWELSQVLGNWTKPFIAVMTSTEKKARTGDETFSLVKEGKMKELVYHHSWQILCMLHTHIFMNLPIIYTFNSPYTFYF